MNPHAVRRCGIAVAVMIPGLASYLVSQTHGWVQVPTGIAPWFRTSACFVFDSFHNRTVLHGGHPNNLAAAGLNDTWTWDGATWTPLVLATVPPWGEGARMAFDSQRGVCVRFGGWNAGVLAETWEFDGSNWTLRTPAVSPPPRTRCAMAYDSVRGRTVVFGGLDANWWALGDTWEWDGLQWHERTPATSPPARGESAMVFDSLRGRAVMFGGVSSSILGDTWEWDGTNWQQAAPAVTPPARAYPAMAFDSGRNRSQLFGGHTDWVGGNLLGDMWEWDGVAWVQVATPNAPTARWGAAMAFDSVRGVTVLFSGDDHTPGYFLPGDTWEFGVPATYTPFGQGCPGWAGVPWLTAGSRRPLLGQLFELSLYNLPPDHSTLVVLGWSDTTWLGVGLPLDLALIGAPGCSLLVSPDLLYPVFNWAGYATWTLAVPSYAALLGATFYNQAAAIDHINALGLVFTNAGAGMIGNQ